MNKDIKIGDVFIYDDKYEIIKDIRGTFVFHDYLFTPGADSSSHMQWVKRQKFITEEELFEIKAKLL